MIKNQSNQNVKPVRDCFLLKKRSDMSLDEWKAVRRAGITGTDASKILSLNKFCSPLKLFLEKTQVISDYVEPNPKMEFGVRMEPILRRWFQEDSGLEVKTIDGILANKIRPWMLADLDGIIYETDANGNKIAGVLEIKTSAFGEELKDSGINPIWYAQVIHYLAVTGCSFGVIYALVNNEIYNIRVDRNDEVIQALIDKEEEFYGYMQTNNIPAVQAMDNSLMAHLFPSSNETKIELADEYVSLLAELEGVKTEESRIKEKRDEIEAKLKMAIKDNEVAICGDYKISWKSSQRTSVDLNKVREILNEDQLKACQTITNTRTFRISKSKSSKKK